MLLAERPVVPSVDELLEGATSREPIKTGDSKSGASFERVVIDGERYIVKHLHVDDDWIMRSTGDLRCRPLIVWRSGILDLLPACIDHAMVGAAAGAGRNGWGAAILMRDVGRWLIPEGDDRITHAQEAQLLDHMAQMHAAMWGWEDNLQLAPLACRYTYFTREMCDIEARRPERERVPAIAAEGWARFSRVAPSVAAGILELRDSPWPLVDAVAALPRTFLHGDWKMGNLGCGADGRTILLDWAVPGAGPCVMELAWWVALNTARLPGGKDASIATYRAALERHGIETASWWDGGIDLALLGGLVQFGWEKAFAPGPELDWWVERADAGLRRL